MGFQRAAIVGTSVASASIALGLKTLSEPPSIAGYDPDRARADIARAHGAFDRVDRQLEEAVRGADLVIMAMPVTYLGDAFRTVAPVLRDGCLLIDIAPLMAPVRAWATELLPQHVRFASGHVIINPVRYASWPSSLIESDADLLRGALFCFSTPPGTTESLVDELSSLATSLGAHPFFMDATEHDGMQAGVEALPSLVAVALLLATIDTPGWREMRKFAGERFAAATASVEADYEDYPTLYHNRANVLLRLNRLLGELIRMRDILTQGDVAELEATFGRAVEARANWVQERAGGLWGVDTVAPMDEVPTSGEQVGRLVFGERVLQRLRKGPDSSKRS